MSLIGLTSAAQGLTLKNGGGMKIRIAKKKLKKVISDAYQINKRGVLNLRGWMIYSLVDMVIVKVVLFL